MIRGLRLIALVAVLLMGAGTLAGCGQVDQAREQVRQRIDHARQQLRNRAKRVEARFRARRDALRGRLKEVLAGLQPAVPPAQQTKPTVTARGREKATTIDAFLTDVLGEVDRYWEKTFAKAGLPQPHIAYDWIAPGQRVTTGCRAPADDSAAFYCPVDDTIYVAQVFAAELYRGLLRGLPGEAAGYGHAAGEFAVAYVVAHEYAHNVQQELGVFDNRVTRNAEPFELQADCYAGTWANSVYAQGHLTAADLKQVTDAALAVGDFDLGNAQHHGTPVERRDALLTGFRSGDPSACARFVPAA